MSKAFPVGAQARCKSDAPVGTITGYNPVLDQVIIAYEHGEGRKTFGFYPSSHVETVSEKAGEPVSVSEAGGKGRKGEGEKDK